MNNEIRNIIHTNDIVLGNPPTPAFIDSIITKNLDQCPLLNIIDAGPILGETGYSFENTDPMIIQEYILRLPAGATLLFNNQHEGGWCTNTLEHIYKIIDHPLIMKENIYYASASANLSELDTAVRELNNIPKGINLLGINYWEKYILDHRRPPERTFINNNKEKLFLCFNRMFRVHRYMLLGLLLERNLVSNSYYSFFLALYASIADTYKPVSMEDANTWLSRFSGPAMVSRINKQVSSINLPLTINIDSAANNKNFIDEDDLHLFDNSYFSLVTETAYFNFHDTLKVHPVFFSEKIFKPITMRHPFILAGPPHSLKHLRRIGYKTFSPMINESYDDITNGVARLLAIVDEVERLSKFSDEEWIKWQNDIKDIVNYNYNVIMNHSSEDYILVKDFHDTQ